MATRRERAADRRAWYAWKLARWLTASSIRSAAWPPPDVDWCRRVYVGHASKPRRAAVVVEFEPDLPLDADATWSARILLPECCRTSRHSHSMDVELDEPDRDGIVSGAGRGARLSEVAVRAGQAWADHAAHAFVPRARDAVAPARSRPEGTGSGPSAAGGLTGGGMPGPVLAVVGA